MSLKIMVVDDEPKTPNLLRVLATPMGHTVQPFSDYQTAAQKGQTQHYDVCFLGMRLAESGGLDLAHKIRKSDANRESIIVMLGTGDDIDCRRKAFGEGADLILNKPIPPDSVRRMLAAFPEWKTNKRCAARLPLFTDVVCSSGGQQFTLRSLNISESGMLLQPSLKTEVGGEVGLQFKIAEFRAVLDVRARVVRKEGDARLAMEFVGLAPEDLNAIHLYVTGHAKDVAQRSKEDAPRPGTRRLYTP